MDRFYLLAPALFLAAAFVLAFLVYSGLHAIGRPPQVKGIKHNQLLGPFTAGFLYWLILPLERLLVGRVSPNLITAVSLVLCALCGVAAAIGHLPAAVWLFVFAGILDVLDGRIARLDGKMTKAGALFDSVSDRWGEMFVFAGYAWYLHETPWMLAVLGAFGASMMVSYTRARAEGLGMDLSGGMMQRAERIVLVTGGTLIAAWVGGSYVVPILGGVMLLLAVTSTATAITRWTVAFRELARRDAASAPVVVEPEGETSDKTADEAAMPMPARIATASLSKPDLRVRPVEQH